MAVSLLCYAYHSLESLLNNDYRRIMRYLKENIADVVILILLAVWGVYEVFMIPFMYDTIVSIFMGCSLVCLFPWACKKTDADSQRMRNAALQYSFTFMISLLCALKIVEVLQEHTFEVDGIKVLFFGVFLQSAYFLIVKWKYLQK